MKLSKSERHTAYIILLAEYEEQERCGYKYSQGICSLMKDFLGLCDEWENNYKYLPEFAAYKPKNSYPYRSWFGVERRGRLKRIRILKKCIEETA